MARMVADLTPRKRAGSMVGASLALNAAVFSVAWGSRAWTSIWFGSVIGTPRGSETVCVFMLVLSSSHGVSYDELGNLAGSVTSTMQHRSHREQREIRAVRRNQRRRFPKTKSKEKKLTYTEIISRRQQENPGRQIYTRREKEYFRLVAERGLALFRQWLTEIIDDLELELGELTSGAVRPRAVWGMDPWTGELVDDRQEGADYGEAVDATRQVLEAARWWRKFVDTSLHRQVGCFLPATFAAAVGEQFLEIQPDWLSSTSPSKRKSKARQNAEGGISWEKDTTPVGCFLIALSRKLPTVYTFERASLHVPGLWYKCQGKVTFPTELDAQVALADSHRKRRRGQRTGKGEVRAYWCMVCAGWHLTSSAWH